jgi:hypothetical protein
VFAGIQPLPGIIAPTPEAVALGFAEQATEKLPKPTAARTFIAWRRSDMMFSLIFMCLTGWLI